MPIQPGESLDQFDARMRAEHDERQRQSQKRVSEMTPAERAVAWREIERSQAAAAAERHWYGSNGAPASEPAQPPATPGVVAGTTASTATPPSPADSFPRHVKHMTPHQRAAEARRLGIPL
jgi:hypothetical protein